MIPALRLLGVTLVTMAAGCAAVKEAPPDTVTLPAAAPSTAAAPQTATEPAPAPLVAPAPPRASAAPPAAAAPNSERTAASAPRSRSESAAKAASLSAKAVAKVPAAPATPAAATEPPRTLPAGAAKPAEPSLDVAALKSRLRDTNAIGVFTKLALKNQVDDLLNQFRSRYQSAPHPDVTPLRQPYNMLVLKVLSLLQDSDPALARTISGSREAIWGILADRDKFSAVT